MTREFEYAKYPSLLSQGKSINIGLILGPFGKTIPGFFDTIFCCCYLLQFLLDLGQIFIILKI